MKNIKLLAISLFVIMAISFSPFVGFAQSNQNNGSNNQERFEQRVNLKSQNKNSNSIWSRISRFFNNKSDDNSLAPVISGITAPTVLKTGEVGTWIVKASDPQNGNLSYSVNWGDTALKTVSVKSDLSFVQTATFTHSYAKTGKYVITFIVKNDANLTSTSKVNVHVIGSSVDAPVISDLNITNIKARQATVTWVTDVRANSMVWYSKTSSVTTSAKPQVLIPAQIIDHKINLSKLEPDTTYYLIVGSTTNKSSVTFSPQISFTTLPADGSNDYAPVISNIETKVGTSTGAIAWSTNEKATSKIYYSINSPVSTNSTATYVVVDKSMVTSHAITIYGLASNTTFYFLVESTDDSGNTTLSSEYSFTTNS
ncbi:MAG TPA: fibronectin type III domain-containing protein [Candidatus Paceibacterota bacterium]|nr:fibronectin type III domain-containing protein [Candidatus Paceibacterota bacterium]HPT18362.1 fibronectin type III domain-containing protein [Candidatus Paceibacterota bacterium]